MEETELPQAQSLPRGRPFAPGQWGNPAGRQPGSHNRKTLAAAMLLEGEAEKLTRKAVDMGLAGDPTALRLCLERLLPPCRERAIKFAMPAIESAADFAPAMKAIMSALADGTVTPGEAQAVARLVDTFLRALDARDFDARLTALEKADAEAEAATEQKANPYLYRR